MSEGCARRGPAAQVLGLAVSFAICFAAAGVGSLITAPALPGWYAGLARPSWTPPNWVFGPVWSTLYAMMAVAAWLIWRQDGLGRRPALRLFALQLALNVAWSGLFFGIHRPDLAFVDIVLLWLAIAATLVWFGRISVPAAWLFVPYLVWVTFAAVLNFTLWRLNMHG